MAAAFAGGQNQNQFAAAYPQDRLTRKETSLGVVRELIPPEDQIGLKYFPFMDVPTDDFIFNYIKGDGTGLAPARAQNAESELAQKDFFLSGTGRGSIIDWAIKDHYDASHINNYRQFEAIAEQISQGGPLPTVVQNQLNEFPGILARDQADRSRRLYNRLEHIIWTSVVTNSYSYNDGKVQFVTPWGRPSDQTDQAPKSGVYGGVDHDPIGDWNFVDQFMYDRHGVNIKRAIMGRKVANSFVNSKFFNARSGLITQPGSTDVDLRYLLDSWGPQAALNAVVSQTGINPEIYDGVYRTRPIGSTTFTVNRYIPEDVIIFLPDEATIAQYDSNPIGFGKTCTSPHAEGGFTPGFYEWEQTTKDPWGMNKGTGIKAFPIFPHMELSYTMKVDLVTQTNP
jgi:hypothetical protein